MRYGLKLSVALMLTLGGAVLVGIATTLGYLLGGSYTFAGAALLALGCCGAGALWWHCLIGDRAEVELATYLRMSAPTPPPPRLQAILPADVEKMQKRLTDMVTALGRSAADVIDLTCEIAHGMGEVGSHLAGVEAERDRYRIEAEKVREIAAVAARPMRRLPDIGDTLGQKSGLAAYGRAGAALPEEDHAATPSFLRPPPRLVDKPLHALNLAEIEEAIKAAAPMGG